MGRIWTIMVEGEGDAADCEVESGIKVTLITSSDMRDRRRPQRSCDVDLCSW